MTASINFSAGTTVTSTWLNAVDAATFDYVGNIMDYGAVGDGTTDDTAAITSLLASGKKYFYFPGGYTFLTDGGHSLPSGTVLFGKATIKKKSTTLQGMFTLADEAVDNIIQGVTFDGNRTAWSIGNAVFAVAAYKSQNVTFNNVIFNNIIDVGIKFFNSASVLVDGCRFYNIGENGVEFKNYDVDPRTGTAYTGTLPPLQGGHRVVNSWFGKIDNQSGDGSGDGCGILVSAGLLAAGTAYPVKGVSISACHFLNVKRGVWAENNDAGCETEDMTVSECWFRGDVSSYGGDVKDAIGLINVKRCKIINNTIVNVGNMNLVVASANCAAVQISGTNTDIIEAAHNTIVDNTGNTHRMDYGFNLAAGSALNIHDNYISGASDATILTTSANVSNLKCYANDNATSTYSWNNITEVCFKVATIPSGTNVTALTPEGYSVDTEIILPMPVTLVGMSVKMTNSLSSGTITFKPYTSGVNRSTLNITNADFASTIATKAISVNNGVTVAAGERIRVDVDTTSYGTGTHGAIAYLMFETTLKE